MSNNKKVAAFIENKHRDFRPFTWLSMNIVSHGHEVIIGETASIRNGLDIIEPDVWIRGGLSKSPQKVELARKLKEAGGSLVIIESEGALAGDDWYKRVGIHEEMAKYTDKHCTWGSRQRDLLCNNLQDYEEKVVISGSPRFDLLTKQLRGVYNQDMENHERRFGDYVLILSNFAIANPGSKSSKNNNLEQKKYQEMLLEKYISAAQNLATDINMNIVWRPHPNEGKEIYQNRLGDINDIHVVREGDVRSWIMGSEAVIHKSSTAGIESVLLDTPTFSYSPIKNREVFDAELPILVSNEIETYQELLEVFSSGQFLKSTTISAEAEERLIQNFGHIDAPSAAPTITKAIDSIKKSGEVELTNINPSLETKLKRIGVRLFGGNFIEAVGESVFGTDRSGVRNKFPGLTRQELVSEIELIDSVSEESFPEVTVNKIPSLVNTFLIKPTS